jgi:hypothetical protein
VLGNKIANLSQDAELGAGWGYFEFIHPCRVAGARKKFQPIPSNPLGRLCFHLMRIWSGDPFEGIEAQQYWGAHSISNLWNVPKFVVGFFDLTNWHDFTGSVLDRSMFLLLVYCLPLIWTLGKDLVAWTYVLGVLPAMSGIFVSFTRFESTGFPVFIALAAFLIRLKDRWPRVAFVVMSSILHLILLWRFVNYRWAG